MLNLKELRKKNRKELITMLKDLDKEIAMESFNIKNGKSKKTAQLRAMKKDIARLSTVITELKILENIK